MMLNFKIYIFPFGKFPFVMSTRRHSHTEILNRTEKLYKMIKSLTITYDVTLYSI